MGKYQEYVLGAVCFLAAASIAGRGCCHLFLFVCGGGAVFAGRRNPLVFGRSGLAADGGGLRHFPDACRQRLCDGRRGAFGRAAGFFVRGVSGTFLSGAGVPDRKTFGGNHGGDTLGGLRFVRHQLSCTVGAAILRRQRQGNSQRGCDAGDHDFADCHQRWRRARFGLYRKAITRVRGHWAASMGAECLFALLPGHACTDCP